MGDILDFPDYSYNIWKQYIEVPDYEDKVNVITFHDEDGLKSFYCDVLRAEKACQQESGRLHNSKSTKSSYNSLVVPKYVEMAMGQGESDGQSSKEYFYKLGERYKERMESRNLSEVDLPKQCLSQAETSMLLKVSLEYELMLLPDKYHDEGEAEMRQHFATLIGNDVFCSVDVDRMLDGQKWQFLYEPFDMKVAS